ncbi:MAG TPA: hypothetical protein VEB59_13725 [Gemmatimonadales bacterium]|nr:hypothetical protein [Gemmatimonadales bacterium]
MTMPDTQGAGTPASGIGTDEQETGGARGQIRQVKDQVVDQAKSTFRQARDQATSSLADSRRQAADQVGGLASALHSAGEHLRGEQQERIAGLADSFADQVDQVASYLRDVDFQRVARDVEDLARRQPALVFGAAFALGLIGARFLKSSERRSDVEEFEDYDEYGYGTIRAGGQAAGLGFDESADFPGSRGTTGGGYAGA